MKNLILVSHNYHTFLLNEIDYAKKSFDNVYVISLYNTELYNKYSSDEKVKLLTFRKKELHRFGIISLFTILKKEKVSELINSFKNRIFSKRYLKRYLLFLSMERICKKRIKRIVGKNNDLSEFKLLSCWYDCDAYAIYTLKEKYKNVELFSLAHSFEVDPEKNPYILNLFRKNYHNQFKMISFISLNVKNSFIKNVLKPLNLSDNNIEVHYLGTRKNEKGFCHLNKKAPFHILSCSHVVEIKRVCELYLVLKKYCDIPIVWTHIGGGTEFEKLKDLVSKNHNSNLTVELLGPMQNHEIHSYYINNMVDLFINYSKSEGIPVTIMEAFAYGVPVIATDVGGNNEIVNETNGKIVDVSVSDNEFWNNIKRMLQLDLKSRMLYSSNAVKTYEKKFNSDKIRRTFYKKIRNE